MTNETASFDVWVLRDDELRGFWGTKARKYMSIISYCLDHGISHVLATGGINSNNLAGAATLCAEAGIQLTAFAINDHHAPSQPVTGNRLLLRIALRPENLVLIERKDRHRVDALMTQLALTLEGRGHKTLILPEGGGCTQAVLGAMTLAQEFTRQRPEWPDPKLPDHIFIDSGTGLSAAALAAGLFQWLDKPLPKLHVIQMAGFEEQILHAFTAWVTPVTGITWADVSGFTRIYRPSKPRSYGATSAELFAFIKSTAQSHGIITDPVYSAKMFMRAFELIKGQHLKGRIVLIHTGGMSGLMGYNAAQFG
jgi:1-aminocyclopropane-1-carboxylate deaminase